MRNKLDQAIVDHAPANYRDIFCEFKLYNLDVSFSAFYRYARRLRAAATLHNLAELTLPDEAAQEEFLPKIICQHLIESLLFGKLSPRSIRTLADAYRIASETACHQRASQTAIQEIKTQGEKWANDELFRLAKKCTKIGDHFVRADREKAKQLVQEINAEAEGKVREIEGKK